MDEFDQVGDDLDTLPGEDLSDEEQGTAGQDSNDDLPNDPEALKAMLAEERGKSARANRDAKRVGREAERLKGQLEEEAFAKKHWASEAERLQAELGNRLPSGDKQPSKQSNAADVKSALKGIELDDYIGEEDGLAKLVDKLQETGVIVTASRLDQILNDRINQTVQQQTEAGREWQELVDQYPDLGKRNSELIEAANLEFESLKKNRRGSNDRDLFELAVARAALNLGIRPAEKPSVGSANGNNRERARAAQGGPASRGNGSAGSVALTDAERRDMRRMHPGLSEKDMISIKREALRTARGIRGFQNPQ